MYNIIRIYQDERIPSRVIKRGLTLDEAQAHCRNPQTSSRTASSEQARKHTEKYGPWFDGYVEA